jgi:hypothetical protein
VNASPPSPDRRSRRTLLLIALVTLAPVIASYVAYYGLLRDKQANYGELLPTQPAPELEGATRDGKPFRGADLQGRWTLTAAAPAACDSVCVRALYATRQARTIQGREMDRIARIWFVTDDGTPDPALLAQHPDLTIVRAAPSALARWTAGPDRIYLLDPLGNLVLAYPRDPDIKRMAKDLARLLKASRIG